MRGRKRLRSKKPWRNVPRKPPEKCFGKKPDLTNKEAFDIEDKSDPLSEAELRLIASEAKEEEQ